MVLDKSKTAPASQALKTGTVIFDEFEIQELLGSGISGSVYKCKSRDPRRPVVALKLFRSTIAQDKVAAVRLGREMRALFKVEHPNITRFYDSYRSDQFVGIALEYVEGINLDKLLESSPTRSILDNIDWILQMGSGIQAIHAAGILHRDLKPANIIVSASNELKITDFGLALHSGKRDFGRSAKKEFLEVARGGDKGDARVTAMGSAVGTPAYVAPEYLLDDELDGRSDIYSLGMIAYELMVGNYPFEYEKVLDLLEIKIYEDPIPPHELNSEISPEVSAVIMKAIERKPDQRYQRIEEMLVELRVALQKLTVQRSRERSVEMQRELAPESMFDIDRDVFDDPALYHKTARLRAALESESIIGRFVDGSLAVAFFVPKLISGIFRSKVLLIFAVILLQIFIASMYVEDFWSIFSGSSSTSGISNSSGGSSASPVSTLRVFQ